MSFLHNKIVYVIVIKFFTSQIGIYITLYWSNLGDEDEEDMENGPASKKRRTASNLSARKSSANKYMINLCLVCFLLEFLWGTNPVHFSFSLSEFLHL
jgi:hypothetical protein